MIIQTQFILKTFYLQTFFLLHLRIKIFKTNKNLQFVLKSIVFKI